MTKTSDLIEAIRTDIRNELREELLTELQPIIHRQLYANVFNVKEAAEFFKVSTQTIRRMVKGREIPHFRLRGNIFFRQIDLMKWIDGLVHSTGEGQSSKHRRLIKRHG